MATLQLNNKWVLVTGASSGLGEEMARQLVRDYGANVLIIARREERLIALKNELTTNYACQCEVVAADLANEANYAELWQRIQHLDIHAAILNAGVTHFEEDTAQTWPEFQTLLSTNISTVVYFTRALANHFEATQQNGAILVVGSMAGLSAVPYQSAYSGTKAFLLNYCQGVREEWYKKPYSLSLFAPGGIATSMNVGNGLNDYFANSSALQDVESCAKDALLTLKHRKAFWIPTFTNRIMALGVKLAPRTLSNWLTAAIYRKAWLAVKQK